jgi:RAB protein geranylgeranyltransferase component A
MDPPANTTMDDPPPNENGDNAIATAMEDQDQDQDQDQPPTGTSTGASTDEPARDEEGLLLAGYDVIVCGTGLVQSIVASALARAGKSVLHCDGAEHYGELDAVWNGLTSLEEIRKRTKEQEEQQEREEPKVEPVPAATTTSTTTTSTTPMPIPLSPKGGTNSLRWHATKKTTTFGIGVGTKVQTPYGSGVVQSLDTNPTTSTTTPRFTLAIALDQWKMADGTSPVLYVGTTWTSTTNSASSPPLDQQPQQQPQPQPQDNPLALEAFLSQTKQIQSQKSVHAARILQHQERRLALDVTPAFVLAAGRAVDGMLASGVAEYLEFQTVQGLVWLEDGRLSRVPCTKNDVFSTKLLPPMDKRRLMKFMQLAMDYATQMSAAEELLKDSQQQQQQQQQKDSATATPNTTTSPETEVQSLNERHLNQGRSLARPQNKAVATQDLQILQQCMEQEVSFDDFLKTHHKLSSDKLRSIVRYALAWDINQPSSSSAAAAAGNSPSLSLSQGMSHLRHHLQALGRYGTTAFLVPMYGSGELSQAFCRSAAVFGATYLLRRAPIGIDVHVHADIHVHGNDDDDDNHQVVVQGVIVAGDASQEYPESIPAASRQDKTIQCSQVVVPVNALRSHQQQRKSTGKRILRRISILNGPLLEGDQRHVIIIPPQSSGLGNSHAIHGITLDESVQVAPTGCTVLHLTTTLHTTGEDDDDGDGDDDCSVLDRASHAILQAPEQRVDELYSVTFSHELSTVNDETAATLPKGVHVCTHTGQVLTADVAFEQAQKIFSKICPGKEFLGLSDELDAAIQERALERGYEDEERLMLESALGMI